jgi:hypothetical protein
MNFNLSITALLSSLFTFKLLQIPYTPHGENNSNVIAIVVSVVSGIIAPIIKDWAKAKLELWRKKKGLPPIPTSPPPSQFQNNNSNNGIDTNPSE